MTENRIEQVRAERRRLEGEYAPKIAEARAAVEEVEEEFADVRSRRNAAVDRHKRLVDRYNDQWDVVGKMGGS